jgi:hypothetical protein
MTARSSNRMIVIAVVAAAVIGLGYWGYSVYQKRVLHSGISAILKNAGGALRESLTLEPGPTAEDRLQLAKKLEAHAAAMDKSIGELKRLQVERDLMLADDAENYLITLREIISKRSAASRLYVLHTESLAALQDHMRADNRTGAWVKQAVLAKERAEKDFRDYRLAVATYGTLLGTLASTQKKIAPYVDSAALIDEALLAKARERAIETATRAAAEMEKVRQLTAPK